jgi:predicted nucleic acid-binding protein
MILVDSSVWIDWLRGNDNWPCHTFRDLLQDGAELVTCDRILQEVTQGIAAEKMAVQVEASMLQLTCLNTGGIATARAAATYFRKLRALGLTIRSSNDVVIAALAIEHKLSLLHNDRDFEAIARHTTLKTLRAPKKNSSLR